MPNLFQRLAAGASNVANRAEQGILPAPVDGLFSPEDLQQARQQGMLHLGLSLLGDTSGMGLGPALKQGVAEGQAAYGGALNDRAAQDAALRQKQILTNRDMITKKYAPGPNDDAASMIKKMPSMYADLMRAGDMEGAKNLQGIVERMAELQSQPEKLQTVQLGDRVVTFNPESGKYTDAEGRPVTDLTRHMNADEIAEYQARLAAAREQAAASRALREQAQNSNAGIAFTRQNQKLLDTEQLYGNWLGAYDSAKSADPATRQAAYKSAIVNFSRIADPGQRSSIQMLRYLEQVQPSLVGRLKLTADKLANGEFPPEVLEALNRHVNEIHAQHVQEYEMKRAGRIKAQPQLESFIDPVETAFPLYTKQKLAPATADTAAPGQSRVNRYFKGWGQ